MNLQQLIELAILDAMGLLDDDERALFESAFRGAAPAVQAQVRREQTRLSRIESLLPDVTPPAELRSAVIEAVRREIESVEAVVGSVLVPPMVKSERVSPLWRMASVGLAAAVVVLAVTLFEGYVTFKQYSKAVQDDRLLQAMSERFEGTVKDVLFNRDTERVVFRPVSASFKGDASVFLNPEWQQSRFFFQGLESKEGRPLRLAVVDADDHIIQTLAEISSDGRLEQKKVDLKPTVKSRLAILSQDDNGNQTVLGRGEVPGPSL